MKKGIFVLLSLFFVLSIVLSGCLSSKGAGQASPSKSSLTSDANTGTSSNFNPKGLPIVNQPVTLHMVAPSAPLAPNYADMQIFKDLEKQTNVKVVWNNIPSADYDQKKNLILASGDLPDAFYGGGFSDYDITKYSQDGTIIPLDNLIKKYMPNVQKVFQRRPDLKKFVTAPDGHIYGLPVAEELGSGKDWIASDPYFIFINKKWLNELNLPMPTTVEQFQNDLIAFKKNSEKLTGTKDVVPFSFINNWWCADIAPLFAAYGSPDNLQHMAIKNNKIYYTATQPQYKAAVAALHKWVQAGVIDKESFTQDDKAYLAKGKTPKETLGAFVWWEAPEMVGPSRAGDYALVGPLKAPDGTVTVGHGNGSPWGRNAFMITKSDKHPDVTARWIDQLYAPKEAAQIHWGPVGKTMKVSSTGELVFKQLPVGVSMGEYRQKVAPNGVGVILSEDFGKVVAMEERAKVRIDRIKQYFAPVMDDQSMPALFYTPDEQKTINDIQKQLTDYTNKMRAQWLMNGGVDKDWNKYLSTLKNIGLDKYLKVQQAAYDRYENSQK